jgi:hypothetical protein
MSNARTAAELAAIYGASPRRWPEAARGRSTVDPGEARVDALLDADVPPPMPDGLAARIKAAAPAAAAAQALPPVVAPRRPTRGWSRGRKIVVGAGVANLFLASAVAAAWIAGVPQPVKALLGIETSPVAATPAARKGVIVAPAPRVEAPGEVAPSPPPLAPSLEGGRSAIVSPPLPLLSPERVVVAPPPIQSRPPAELVDRAAGLRRERAIERPRIEAVEALRDRVERPEMPAVAIRDRIESLRETRGDRADRPEMQDAAAVRDRIEARRDVPADVPAAAVERPQLPDAATLEAARAARVGMAADRPVPAGAAAAVPATPTAAPPPAAAGAPEQAQPVERPHRVDRPPRRLRERLQRQRQHN